MHSSRSFLFVLALFANESPIPASAQKGRDKTTARNLFFEARDAYDARNYAKAADLFERSNDIYPAPTAALGLARSLAAARRLVRAHETYTIIIKQGVSSRAPAPFTRALADAVKECEALERRLPALTIHVSGPNAPLVTLDGQLVPASSLGLKRFVDPGEHVVSASGAGFEEQLERAVLLEVRYAR